jgi:hypothetical protein
MMRLMVDSDILDGYSEPSRRGAGRRRPTGLGGGRVNADGQPACWSWAAWDATQVAKYARLGDSAGGELLTDWHEGRCAMSGRAPAADRRGRRLYCDHDHDTGLVRGWLRPASGWATGLR